MRRPLLPASALFRLAIRSGVEDVATGSEEDAARDRGTFGFAAD
jgi:hypothetical protein